MEKEITEREEERKRVEEECSMIYDELDKYRKENPIIIAEYKPAIRRLRKQNGRLILENEKLKVCNVRNCKILIERNEEIEELKKN